MVRLRDGLAVLWREPGASQVGVDARFRAVLEDLTEGEQHLLDRLRSAPSVPDLVRAGRSLGVSPERVRALLARLEHAGVLAPDDRPPLQRPGVRPTVSSADAAYWARVREDADGAAVLAARAGATVAVLGACRLGILVATGAAAAGVGTVLVADQALVTPLDVGPGAYDAADVGRRRGDAALDVLRATAPHVRVTGPPRTAPDVAVLVEHGVASPVRSRPLVREDLVHLSVVVGEVDVTIGPLVVPGEGPCLRCLDLTRCDEDPRWPAVATQVAADPPAGVESSLAPLAAALAVGQVLAHLDGREVVARSATLDLDAVSPLPRRTPRAVHPQCGCTGVVESRDA